jgi:hypothetical protein
MIGDRGSVAGGASQGVVQVLRLVGSSTHNRRGGLQMPKGAYLVTNADVSDPREARRLLRKTTNGRATLDEALGTMGELYSGDYIFPDAAVLLMIGNTQELVDEVAAAYNGGNGGTDRMHGNRWAELECYYVRMKISAVQTDTILALGTKLYWDSKRQAAIDGGWCLLKNIGPEAVWLLDDASAGCLPELIRQCKAQWTGQLLSTD